MIRILSILLFSIYILNTKGQPDTALIRTYGSSADDYGRNILALTNGDYLITGTTASRGNGNTDIYFIRVDSNGIYKWSKTFGKHNIEWGLKTILTADNNFVCVGYSNSFGNGGYDILLLKIDTSGNYIWQKNIGSHDWDFGYDITELSDSSLIIAGATYKNGYKQGIIIKTNSQGDTIWSQTINHTFESTINAICRFSDNTLFVTGTIKNSNNIDNIYLAKYNENGNLIWEKIYNKSFNNISNTIIKTADNHLVIAGKNDSITSQNWEIYIEKLDTSGNSIWNHTYSHAGIEYVNHLVQLPDNGFILCSNTNSFGAGGYGIFVFRMDANGYWINSPTFGGVNDDLGYAITQNINGNIAIVGETESYGFGRKDVYLVIFKNDNIVSNYYLQTNFYNDTTSVITNSHIPVNTNNKLKKIFPNPTSDILYLSIEPHLDYEISIFDATGKIVLKNKIENISVNIYKIELAGLPNGLYFLNVYDIYNEQSFTEKFIINTY